MRKEEKGGITPPPDIRNVLRLLIRSSRKKRIIAIRTAKIKKFAGICKGWKTSSCKIRNIIGNPKKELIYHEKRTK